VVFSSPTFLFAFLPLTLLLSTLAPARARNVVLLAASVAFYIWGAGGTVDVIIFVSAAAWIGGLLVALPRLPPLARRIAFIAAIAAVLGPLLWFKYVPGLTGMANGVGVPIDADHFGDIVLPLGISFFTFHGISYLVDVWRRDIPAERRPIRFALYLFLFPHQIAGPIVRYAEIQDEIREPRRPDTDAALFGMSRFAWGLFKKAFVADSCAVVANSVYALPPSELTGPTAWIGALAYALQIYFDFSGYSDMAIGLAAMMGFHFPENFNGPYRAVSVTDFWRRWHMTLSRWFRDYVYIPFGGNRHGVGREYAGLLLTFFLTSLWHGATWTFLLWGGLHSAALLFERFTGLRRSTRWLGFRRILMIVFVLGSWVPFRAETLRQTAQMWKAMAAGSLSAPPPTVLVTLTPWALAALAVGCLSFVLPRTGTGYQWVSGAVRDSTRARFSVRRPAAAFITAALLPAAVVAVFWLDFSPFLYFRF
jgi:alginate O-acetyltransferase complex protein AlgI